MAGRHYLSRQRVGIDDRGAPALEKCHNRRLSGADVAGETYMQQRTALSVFVRDARIEKRSALLIFDT